MFFAAGHEAGLAGSASTHSGVVRPVDAPNTIAIFESPAVAAGLRKQLVQMTYQAVCAPCWAQYRSAAAGAQPLAAIIGDTLENPFAVCAEMPADLPKILISADQSFAMRKRAMSAGIDAMIARPFLVSEVLDWLEHFEANRAVAPFSVVLIDDDVCVAKCYAEVLQSAGMLVDIVSTAADAIPALERQVPDLILLDINMPGTDGIELARMIRSSRRHLSVPIVFLSGAPDERLHMAAARQSGGGDIITKPITAERLVCSVTLRAERARTLRTMIERDSLTGLLSHGHFVERSGAVLAQHRRAGLPCSLAMIDIDHFKGVNDRFGHPAGDQVIRTLSRALLARTRAGDVVGRCGGEEFGILLAGIDIEEAHALLDGVRASFNAMSFGDDAAPFRTSFSAGLAASGGLDLPSLVRLADEALYVAKLKGRNRVECTAIARRGAS